MKNFTVHLLGQKVQWKLRTKKAGWTVFQYLSSNFDNGLFCGCTNFPMISTFWVFEPLHSTSLVPRMVLILLSGRTCTPVDGRNPAPVEVGSLSHYLLRLKTSQVVVWDFWTINRYHPAFPSGNGEVWRDSQEDWTAALEDWTEFLGRPKTGMWGSHFLVNAKVKRSRVEKWIHWFDLYIRLILNNMILYDTCLGGWIAFVLAI